MRKLVVTQTLKGSRIFDIGESFLEGSAEFAELEPEIKAGLVKLVEPKFVHPATVPPEPVPESEPETEPAQATVLDEPEPAKRKRR